MNNVENMSAEVYDNYADGEDIGVVSSIIEDQLEDSSSGCRVKKKMPTYLLQAYLRRVLIAGLYITALLFLIVATYGFIRGVITLDYKYIESQIFFYPLFLLMPFVAWGVGTLEKYLEYEKRKIGLLLWCVLSGCLLLMYATGLFCVKLTAPLVLAIPLSPEITDDMLLLFIRALMVFPPIVFAILMFHSFFLLVIARDMRADIMHFKLERYIDFRADKKYKYDMAVVRKKVNGKVYAVKEAMRAYHMMIVGATGSGKTSMGLNPAIANDMDKHILNLNKLKQEILKLIYRGKVRLTKDFEDADFSRDCFEGVDSGATDKLNDLFRKYQRCGITVIAPNSSFADDIYELAKNRGFKKINRIDPEIDNDGNYKPNFIGLNPLYVNPDLDVNNQYLIIVNKARVFSDVLQALFEAGGKSDVYFNGLNRQFTSSICTILMKAAPLLHERFPSKYIHPYVTPADFYNCINDFPRMKDYVDVLENYLLAHPSEDVNYRNKLTLIKRDILGPGAEDMLKQCRGLVVQAGELLDNPHIRNILCCENTVDFDRALAESEFTLVNYSLALGDSDSRALGLFVLLLFQGAVFRRPKNNRPIHFLDIDEFPVLLHKNMEKCFSIFRQYNVALSVALQSLSQFEKDPSTAFMKNVLLVNASTQLIFGRAGTEEMKIYQELSGKRNEVVVQDTVSQTALSDSDPGYSYSERSGLQMTDVVTGRDIRNKDFSEGTLYTVDKGNPVDGFGVVLDFITPKQKTGLRMEHVDWHSLYKKQTKSHASKDNNLDVAAGIVKGQLTPSPVLGANRVGSDKTSTPNNNSNNAKSNVPEYVGSSKFKDNLDVDNSLNFNMFDLMAQVGVTHEHIGEKGSRVEKSGDTSDSSIADATPIADDDLGFGSLSSDIGKSDNSVKDIDSGLFSSLDQKLSDILGNQ